jgi:hypothetical protein
MRGIQVAVPQQAKDRLDELTLLRDSALEASHSAQRRLNMLSGDGSQLALKLADERNRQADAHNVLHRLLSACNQYLFQLRLAPGCYLEEVTTLVKLTKGETPSDAIDAVRSAISAVQREMALLRAAPLSRQSQQDAIHSYLARLALAARPKLNFDPQLNPMGLKTTKGGRLLGSPHHLQSPFPRGNWAQQVTPPYSAHATPHSPNAQRPVDMWTTQGRCPHIHRPNSSSIPPSIR